MIRLLSIAIRGVKMLTMNETLGAMVRREREARRWTGRRLAAALDIEPSALSRIENDQGTHPPAPEVMRALRDVLGLDEREMLRALGYLNTEMPTPITEGLGERYERAVQRASPEARRLLLAMIDAADREDGEEQASA